MSSKTSIVASLPLHTSHSGAGPVNALSFSPDKNFVIVGGRDGRTALLGHAPCFRLTPVGVQC